MTSKERLMTAIHKGIPDRLPASVHQWQDYHLKYYLNNIDALSAFKMFKLDAEIQYFDTENTLLVKKPEIQNNTKQWIDEIEILDNSPQNKIIKHIIHTPEGDLSYKTRSNEKTTWMIENPIKKFEDVDLLRYMPIHKLDKEEIRKTYDLIGDDGIYRGYIWGDQAGCWQQACVYYGTSNMLYAGIDNPDWVHYFLNLLLEKKLQYIYEEMNGAKFDIIETGGGDASSTVISPKFFEEFCLPYDRKLHDALHSLKHLVSYHTCGGMYGIFDLIIKTGTDVSETLSPKSIGGNIDGPELYEAMHGKVALRGGLDQVHLLEKGFPKDIEKEVYRLFDVFGKGGGYICSACDHFFEAPIENIEAFSQAAHNCVY
ncbi:MAG: hypothetical protein M1479_05275 [Actinobacteria bacterium]|nr:hypothetical protein [Cyanobacteriota bacterium]MCL5771670.1 hypothetical protein [Actinomycetota bacterium]